jgi:cell division septation protein DedD
MYFGRMFRLERTIQDLLLVNDCVSIPNFGGLVAQRFRAEINYGTNIMRPPTKRISFHEGLAANSHLLVGEIAKSAKLSVEEATEFISKTVKNWQLELAAGNSVKVEGIGRFYQDKNGAICFNQSLESNFDLEAFGLDIFRANAIKRDAATPEAVQTAILNRIKKERSSSFPYWQAAAVFTGIGALLTVGFFKTDINLNDKFKATFNPMNYSRAIEMPTPVTIARKLPVVVETPVETKKEEVAPEVTTPKVEVKPIAEAPKKAAVKTVEQTANLSYHVVVGSFNDMHNATELMASLQEMGYAPVLVDADASFKKVSIQGFATRAEAARALNLYKGKVNKGAWIYTIK